MRERQCLCGASVSDFLKAVGRLPEPIVGLSQVERAEIVRGLEVQFNNLGRWCGLTDTALSDLGYWVMQTPQRQQRYQDMVGSVLRSTLLECARKERQTVERLASAEEAG